jgi:hypothetical protein
MPTSLFKCYQSFVLGKDLEGGCYGKWVLLSSPYRTRTGIGPKLCILSHSYGDLCY